MEKSGDFYVQLGEKYPKKLRISDEVYGLLKEISRREKKSMAALAEELLLQVLFDKL